MELAGVLKRLEALAEPEKIAFKQEKFGIAANNSLGIYQKDLKELARQIGKNDELALALYDTGIYEARLLTSRLYNPKKITRQQMNKWAREFENWEICDSFSMGFFTASPYALEKALQWSDHKKEFIKRAAFAMMASYGFVNKQDTNEVFEQFFPLIERESWDERIYVKKAVNWALRSIGKRNVDLQEQAIEVAHRIAAQGSKPALWIAKDALRELQKPSVKIQDHPRSIYRA
ncbi:MAG: DNA alkylation repair protein [Pseudomonadota bacterium]